MFHYFPETVENIKRLCNSANITYTVAENQTCCGLPYFEKGEQKAAKSIAEYNLAAFGDNSILSMSLKCLDTYTVKYPKILNNTVSHVQCMKLANSAKGLQYLFDNIQLNGADKINGSYFFIPDCATDKQSQSAWLSKLRNARFHQALLENTCCGAGFCLPALNPEEAEKMTLGLIQQALASGAETIVTTNEICLRHIINVSKNKNQPVKGMHLIDLFASAL
jgi:L-lactate dehydrogenase complex protein LldE